MPKKQFVTFRTVILVFIGLTLFVCCAAANNPNTGTKKPAAPDAQPLAPAIATGKASDTGATPIPAPTLPQPTPTLVNFLATVFAPLPTDTPAPATATRPPATSTPKPTLAATRPPATIADTKPAPTAVPIPTATQKPALPPGGNYGGSVNGYAPVDALTCPDYAPIKGNKNSMIYHRPGQIAYGKTKPEVCFARAEDAEASGFRAAKR